MSTLASFRHHAAAHHRLYGPYRVDTDARAAVIVRLVKRFGFESVSRHYTKLVEIFDRAEAIGNASFTNPLPYSPPDYRHLRNSP